MNKMPKPIAMTSDTVTLSRADWERVVEQLDDAADRAALRRSLAGGEDDALPAVLYRRIRKGESPVRVWREHRTMGLNALARRAGISASYLSEIESRAKPGSAAALRKLAAALSVGLDELV
ncbi:MAG TPA: helix-turn-helix transcriptional regulator [Rhizomicrobium sp.]|nr:helix-turn-helix transcriptional regulator [Rhizomicrobium sp.]